MVYKRLGLHLLVTRKIYSLVPASPALVFYSLVPASPALIFYSLVPASPALAVSSLASKMTILYNKTVLGTLPKLTKHVFGTSRITQTAYAENRQRH